MTSTETPTPPAAGRQPIITEKELRLPGTLGDAELRITTWKRHADGAVVVRFKITYGEDDDPYDSEIDVPASSLAPLIVALNHVYDQAEGGTA